MQGDAFAAAQRLRKLSGDLLGLRDAGGDDGHAAVQESEVRRRQPAAYARLRFGFDGLLSISVNSNMWLMATVFQFRMTR